MDMLKYILVENQGNKIMYKYFPEGGDDFGVVVYDKQKKECSIQELAKIDRHRQYALKMFKRLREFADGETFLEEGKIAWY